MSLTRWAAKRDDNEGDVVRAITQVGAQHLRLDAFDLLVLFRGRIHMLEVKTKTGRLTDSQQDLIATGWPLRIVRNVDDALRAIGAL